jgi:hypothetical protein
MHIWKGQVIGVQIGCVTPILPLDPKLLSLKSSIQGQGTRFHTFEGTKTTFTYLWFITFSHKIQNVSLIIAMIVGL